MRHNSKLAKCSNNYLNLSIEKEFSQGGRGHRVVYCNGPKSGMIKFSYSLAYTLGDYNAVHGLVHCLECLNVLTTNYNESNGQFGVLSLGMYINCLIPLDPSIFRSNNIQLDL